MSGPGKLEILEKIITKFVEKGITPVFDGPSIILIDKSGNKLVDFTNGLGPIGSDLTMMTKLEEASSVVKALVRVPLSDNQMLAITSFCSHIGGENFGRSGVLRQLNNKNYVLVPEALLRWRVGSVNPNEPAEVRLDFQHRREFESELFTTPDIVKIDFNIEGENKATWKQLTARLKKRKQEAMGVLLEGQVKGNYLEFGDLSKLINNGPSDLTGKSQDTDN